MLTTCVTLLRDLSQLNHCSYFQTRRAWPSHNKRYIQILESPLQGSRRPPHHLCRVQLPGHQPTRRLQHQLRLHTRTHSQQSRAQKFQGSPKSCSDEAAVRDDRQIG
ncbi:hypothetical protein MRX96_045284 [Rhipicephalus microplus]